MSIDFNLGLDDDDLDDGVNPFDDLDDKNSVAVSPVIRVAGAQSQDEALDMIAEALDYWNSMQERSRIEVAS